MKRLESILLFANGTSGSDAALRRAEALAASNEALLWVVDVLPGRDRPWSAERVEIYREQCSDLMGTYLSMVSNRMNEVMRVLTVMASIFIPLTFLAGIYGMNFNPDASPMNLPELNWRWGYPVFWAVIIAMAAGMVLYFRRKRWW